MYIGSLNSLTSAHAHCTNGHSCTGRCNRLNVFYDDLYMVCEHVLSKDDHACILTTLSHDCDISNLFIKDPFSSSGHATV